MLYFASSRNQSFVSKIVDSVGPVSNVAADDTRLRGDRNDKQNVEENDAKRLNKMMIRIGLLMKRLACHCVHIRILFGLYLPAKPSVYLAV